MNNEGAVILAVEDDERNAALLRAVLEPAGYRLAINSIVGVLAYRRTNSPRVEVVATTQIPTWDMEPRTAIVATNTGHLPVTVTGMSFELSNGEQIALMDGPPGHDLPAVLGPGESRNRWAPRDEVVEQIRTRGKGAHIERAVAVGPGSGRWRSKRLHKSFRRLGYE